ncbi:MAG: hypothetical protein WC305_01590 [Bacteroidales bacterium]|jgi:hypothetical protein
MEVAGLIISIIALLLALFTYFKHDLKIKKQAALINKYQIEKIEKEKDGEKKAIIETNVIKDNKGTRLIKVYNKGKSVAKNVIVTIPKTKWFEVINNPCPIDIKPQNGIEISLVVFMGGPDKIDINYEWSDDFSDKNNDNQTIQL